MSEKTVNGLYAALAKAQTEMGKALKDSDNPHFKSKYADLASVMAACMPALNANGIAVLQPTHDEDGRMYVKTIFVHASSGETAECRVPLIVAKNDMQGYGSAVTYARRYGLMSMAGIAPEDDDGNAAANAAPKMATAAHMKRRLAELQNDLLDANSEGALTGLWREWSTIMNNENWPAEADETSFRAQAKEMFRQRKQDMAAMEDEPVNVLAAG